MKSRFPTRHCPICGDKLIGRKDKVFCSSGCKNDYHRRRKLEHMPFSNPIDQILHRNWVILAEFHEIENKKKFYIPMSDLQEAGFHTKYYTTTSVNSQNKTYFYIYNYGWMQFSEKQVMVVHLDQSK